MINQALRDAVLEALSVVGEERLLNEIQKLAAPPSDAESAILTIVANKGVHHLPPHHIRGEIYYASEGSLDFGSPESVNREMMVVLTQLASKLKSRAWQKIYLVPFGPTNLSILIKLLVYRVTHIETIDLFHAGSGTYFELSIPLRSIVIAAP